MQDIKQGPVRFQTYSREQVHDIFAAGTRFIPQAGTWGLHGVVPVPGRPRDWVFFVTFGKRQAHHTFNEHISPEGLLQWQSQLRQTLADPIVQSWINHDPCAQNIYLFLRTQQPGPYWYLGRLAYVNHDPQKECPVYFTWQILDWNPPETIRQALGITVAGPRQMALTSVVASRYFLYAQKFSRDVWVLSDIHRYANSHRGVARLAKYAEGTTLAVRWPDLALVPLTKLLPDELQKALVILPKAGTADQRNKRTEELRSVAVDVRESRHPVAKNKIVDAEDLALNFFGKLGSVRQARHKVSEILNENFPEFSEVFRNWRTKGALWVLENHPTPTDILTHSTTELAAGVTHATRGRISLNKVVQLQLAADRALAHSSQPPEPFRHQLEAALSEWRSAHEALETVQRRQDTLRETGRFPMPPSHNAASTRGTRQTVAPIRRTGGRYHTASRRREPAEGQKKARVELVCRQYSAGWQVLLRAEGAREVWQNGAPLKQVAPSLWLLGSLETVLVDGRQVSVYDQVLIFRLSDTATGLRGRRVENISRDSFHLLVASQELTTQGGEPADMFNLDGYQAVLLGPNSAIRVLTADKTDLLRMQQSPTVADLRLTGKKGDLDSVDTPLFIGDFPALTGKTSEPVRIIVGYEGTASKNWRAQMTFDGVTTNLADPPGKLGWFFVRCYDPSNILLRGWDFRWVRDVSHLQWDAVRSELTLSHDSSLIVEALSQGIHVDRSPDVTRCTLPLGPEYNRTWWRISDSEDVRDYIELPLRVPRIQWALGPEDSRQNLQWTQKPLTLRPSDVKATSTQAIYVAVSTLEPVRSPSLILWVGHNRLASVRLDDGLATIPLRNLTTYAPTAMDRPQPLQFAVASNHQVGEQTTLGQFKSMPSCGRCSQAFESIPELRQHFWDAHPIELKSASTYEAYYALAKKAGLADELPAKVYKCRRCGHTEIADNPYVNNATSAMSQHFNQVHRGETRHSLNVVHDTSEIAQLFDRVLEPLGECSECRAVLRVNQPTEWKKHQDMHRAEWTMRS